MKFLKLKNQLKKEAKEIRKLKSERKQFLNGYSFELDQLRYHNRHKHIAYCLLRGREMAQIERKVAEGNEPSERLIERYMEEYNEAICDS